MLKYIIIFAAPQLIKRQGLPADYRPHVHLSLEMNDRPTKCVIRTPSPPAVIDFYRFKSVATQNPHDAGLAPIPSNCQKVFCPASNQRYVQLYELKATCLNRVSTAPIL